MQLYFEDGKVWISTRPPPEPVVNYVTLLHLDLDLPWDLEVDPQLPHGAVLTETIADWPIKLAGQEFQFIEVTQVGGRGSGPDLAEQLTWGLGGLCGEVLV